MKQSVNWKIAVAWKLVSPFKDNDNAMVPVLTLDKSAAYIRVFVILRKVASCVSIWCDLSYTALHWLNTQEIIWDGTTYSPIKLIKQKMEYIIFTVH